MTINERIKWYRKELGLSQQYIAKKLHQSRKKLLNSKGNWILCTIPLLSKAHASIM